jgi:hypothetical protein
MRPGFEPLDEFPANKAPPTGWNRASPPSAMVALAPTARSYQAVMTGEFDNAKVFIRTAMRLRVGDAGMRLCLPSKALADLHLGNLQEALRTAHWAVRLQPKFWLGRQVLAACLSVCDQLPEAVQATAELKRDYAGLFGRVCRVVSVRQSRRSQACRRGPSLRRTTRMTMTPNFSAAGTNGHGDR